MGSEGAHRARPPGPVTGSRGSLGIPGSLVDQPFGQLAAPANTSEARAIADISRYRNLRSRIGLPPFPRIVAGNVTGELSSWQSQGEPAGGGEASSEAPGPVHTAPKRASRECP